MSLRYAVVRDSGFWALTRNHRRFFFSIFLFSFFFKKSTHSTRPADYTTKTANWKNGGPTQRVRRSMNARVVCQSSIPVRASSVFFVWQSVITHSFFFSFLVNRLLRIGREREQGFRQRTSSSIFFPLRCRFWILRADIDSFACLLACMF